MDFSVVGQFGSKVAYGLPRKGQKMIKRITLEVDITGVLFFLRKFQLTASEAMELLDAVGYSKSEKEEFLSDSNRIVGPLQERIDPNSSSSHLDR